jgi:hypothetical protein
MCVDANVQKNAADQQAIGTGRLMGDFVFYLIAARLIDDKRCVNV